MTPFVSFSQLDFYNILKHSSIRMFSSLRFTFLSIMSVATGCSQGTMSVVSISSKCALYGLEVYTKVAKITTKMKTERRRKVL